MIKLFFLRQLVWLERDEFVPPCLLNYTFNANTSLRDFQKICGHRQRKKK